jgi:hypothetical protein
MPFLPFLPHADVAPQTTGGAGNAGGRGSKRFQLFDGDAIATNPSDFARLPYGSAPTASWDAA